MTYEEKDIVGRVAHREKFYEKAFLAVLPILFARADYAPLLHSELVSMAGDIACEATNQLYPYDT